MFKNKKINANQLIQERRSNGEDSDKAGTRSLIGTIVIVTIVITILCVSIEMGMFAFKQKFETKKKPTLQDAVSMAIGKEKPEDKSLDYMNDIPDEVKSIYLKTGKDLGYKTFVEYAKEKNIPAENLSFEKLKIKDLIKEKNFDKNYVYVKDETNVFYIMPTLNKNNPDIKKMENGLYEIVDTSDHTVLYIKEFDNKTDICYYTINEDNGSELLNFIVKMNDNQKQVEMQNYVQEHAEENTSDTNSTEEEQNMMKELEQMINESENQ